MQNRDMKDGPQPTIPLTRKTTFKQKTLVQVGCLEAQEAARYKIVST